MGLRTARLHEATARGERARALDDGRVLDETPSWFSDGDRVAFQSNRSGRMEIWTVKVNGMELRRVTGSAR
ncbi:MAG TPA: hypothetical protein VLJ83_06330 [Gemmatimonadaceae bacterium]|nr:hypothetical protein [Gemmatimonadaceae bacterium]